MAVVNAAIFYLLTLGMGFYSRFLLSILSIFALLNGWRLLSSGYIEEQDVVLAPEVDRVMVSLISVDLIMLLTLLLFLFCMLLFFTPKSLAKLRAHLEEPMESLKANRLETLFLFFSVVYGLFIIATTVSSAPLSQYPIISGMHRRDFIVMYGNGVLIDFFFKTMTYATTLIGVAQLYFFLYKPLKSWKTWVPFAAWLCLFFFLIAQGHRFSTLIWDLYFFYLPLSLLFVSKKQKIADRVFVTLGGLFAVAVVAMFIHSFEVGGFHQTEKLSYLTQRILIDQSQLWNLTANRVFGFGESDTMQAGGVILESYFGEANYNRSAQFLMYKVMGAKAYDSWDQNHIITMGFPESILDLVGEQMVFLWVFFLSLLLMFLFHSFFHSLAKMQVIHCIGKIYLLNPLIYLFTGGTANAVIASGYLAKCFLVIVFLSGLDIVRSEWPRIQELVSRFRRPRYN